ncbi:MAG: DUF4180 domain-containing protein [Pedobacter sp.]|nr:MAG: DUF4180 domain-containing protein [Pedobacter sp.]
MEIKIHHINQIKIAEVKSDKIVINSADDGLDLLGNLYYQGFDKIIIHEEQITTDFFDLSTGIAGEILQKFSNYRVKLAIVGEFIKYKSNSLKDFISESNKTKHISFVANIDKALETLK